ncbi:arabinogalactan endo-beta-1,4-galactanase [Pediococcus siamensis]|uniref:glycoside hydrolase family 53 protein n=1 Tax=Pediococcus siamensis TaxID=381829 RepID=UPI0039A39BE1
MKKWRKLFAQALMIGAGILVSLSAAAAPVFANADGTTNVKNDQVTVNPVHGVTPDAIRGVDISSLQAELNAGVKFYGYDGKEQDILQTLEDSGVNYVRLRIWNDPYDSEGHTYGGGDATLANEVKTAKDATAHHMKVLIDLQYSDFWADPAKQALPKAWKNYSFAQKKTAVYNYTEKVMKTMKAAGVDIGMVQVGNETTKGMMQETDPAKYMQFIAQGVNAVHKYAPGALAAVHYESPSKDSFAKIAGELKDNKVNYDVMGATYYPHWNGPDSKLIGAEKVITQTYKKKFAVMEMSYPYTTDDMDGQPNIVGSISNPPFAISVQGQADAISDVWKTVMQNGNGRALGGFYWEPAWIPVKAGWDNYQYNRDESVKYGTGWATEYAAKYYGDAGYADQQDNVEEYWGASSYDNQALFDPNGYPLQSLLTFKKMITYNYVSKTAKKPVDRYKVAKKSAYAYTFNGTNDNFTFKKAFSLSTLKGYYKIDKAADVVKSNGTTYLYYHITSGKKSAWIWHSYLKKCPNKVTKTTKVNYKHRYVVKNKKGNVYGFQGGSQDFQFVTLHHLKNYPHTHFVVSRKTYVKKYNGVTYKYYYVHSLSGTVHGYVWHGYLK